MSEQVSTTSFYKLTRQYIRLMYLAEVKLSALLLPMLLGILASLAEGFSMYLLVPLIDVMLFNSFTFFESIASYLPQQLSALLFSSGKRSIAVIIVAFLCCSTVKVFCSYIGNCLIANLARQFQIRLRLRLFGQYLSFGKLYIDQKSVGYFYHILMDDSNKVASTLYFLQGAVQAITTIIVYTALMVSISAPLTVTAMLAFPLLYFALKGVIKTTQAISSQQSYECVQLSQSLQNLMTNMPLIKSYSTENQEKSRFARIAETVAGLQLASDKRNLLIAPIQEMVLLFFLIIIVLMLYYLYIQPGGNPALAALFIAILRRSSSQVNAINNFWHSLASLSGPIKHLDEFKAASKHYALNDGDKEEFEFKDCIEFRSVSFKYNNDRVALKDLNFKIARGSTVALVGHTGAGKSTLVQLLLRFYDPSQGEILVDGININELKMSSWRIKIAYVSQEALLFHDTLRANLCYGLEPLPEPEQLSKAIEVARLSALLDSLPEGLDTSIGDKGVQLSGGERQRISLARAFLKQAEILILDEATSALDSNTEADIENALSEYFKERTVIKIAHRLSTIANAEMIFVLEEGKIVESGSRNSLLEDEKGLFYSLWKIQNNPAVVN